ncbi:MAG: LemA family protein [Treponema sp.]|uniref:LemA family protein n=1 Tax=Treponema sp. TaxID=166 RepID=UPI00298DA31F|nr:LemA family protein [Treponema sp.]MBR5934016.1 LemA family protein [Treponema sp.]
MKSGTKSVLTVVGVILVIVFMIYRFFAGNYNTMVSLDESVKTQWAQVQNQYQRRMDLIPNLVNTVKGYAKHESEVFTQIADARSKAGGVVNIDSSVLEDEEQFAKYQKVQNELGASLQRLLAITENYPELKADSNFLALQDQLEGTENRIATERKRYNEIVSAYNQFIRRFPQSFVANMNGFKAKAYFTASEEAQTAPTVEF